eukprot:9373163-Pyramimonas_sp.AAC.1
MPSRVGGSSCSRPVPLFVVLDTGGAADGVLVTVVLPPWVLHVALVSVALLLSPRRQPRAGRARAATR